MSSSHSYLSLCVYGIVILWLSVCESADPLEVTAKGFSPLEHGVSSGKISILNEKQIQIEGMMYDGKGPAAFFVVGSKVDAGKPDFSDIKLLPDENGDCTTLKAYDGSKPITLSLPPDVKITEIKFLAVYCVKFSVNFGFIEFPATVDPATLPPLPVAPAAEVPKRELCVKPDMGESTTTPAEPREDTPEPTTANAPRMSFIVGNWKGSWLLLLFIAVPYIFTRYGN